MKPRPKDQLAGTLAVAALFLTAAPSGAQITATLLDEETDIVNTGGTVVSAVHFQNPTSGDPSPLVVNGISHIVGQANEPLLSDNIGFEGDFRNGASGLPQDGSDIIQVLLSGIGGANGLTLDISGLTVGEEYLFQVYWEDDRGTTLTATLEGTTQGGIAAQQSSPTTPGGTLISYQFVAGDDTFNAFIDRDDSVVGDPNNWLSGYSLQEVAVAGNPVLTGTAPADDAIDVPTNNNLVASFDKTVQAPAVGTGNITLYKADDTLVEAIDVKDVTPPGTVAFAGSTVTIDPTAPLEGGVEYYVLIDATAITDTADNPFAGISDKTAWTFTADGTAPSTLGMGPVANANNVLPTADLTLSFDEGVEVGSGKITIKLASDDSDVQVIDVTSGNVVIDGTEVTISLPAELALSTAYYVNIDSGAFQDPSGNAYAGISDKTTWAFTTAASNPFTISILDEETDIVNTGGALVSAANFGAGEELVINGLTHAAGNAGGANLTSNFTFEGDFRENASGLPDGTPINEVFDGIAGANGIIMSISGLTVGREDLFQAYWEQNPDVTLTITMEGVDTITKVADQVPGVLISYAFTAGDDTLDIDIDRDDNLGGDQNNWLSGYSLQEVSLPPVEITSITEVGVGVFELSVLGASDTGYEFRSSPILDFNPGALVEGLTAGVPAVGTIGGANDSILITDSNGAGTVRMALAGLANFVVAQVPPPLLDENFDAGVGVPAGWDAADNGMLTEWQVDDPSTGPPEGPDAAASGANCAGTNIMANYTPDANVTLTSPVIAIPAGGATLSFQQYIDTDGTGDVGTVRLLDADNADAEIIDGDFPVTPIEGLEQGWTGESCTFPAAALGKNVKVQFQFVSDPDTEVYSGFYIDDVAVNATP